MTIKEFILGRQVYAQFAGQDTPICDMYKTFSSIKNNTCYCSIDDEEFDCLQEKQKMSESCTNKFGALYIQQNTEGDCLCKDVKTDGSTVLCSSVSPDNLEQYCSTQIKYSQRDKETSTCKCVGNEAKNQDGTNKTPRECIKTPETLGIKCTAEQLINNTCSRNINKTLGIRQSDPTPSPTLLLQDVVLGATSFVGTVMMIGLVYLGFMVITKGADDSDAMTDIKSKAKNMIIGLILIIASYSIIRIIQYVAKGV